MGANKIILKCTECGNTFSKEGPTNDEIVCCPICDAQYRAVVKLGKLHLEDFVFEEKDLGEL
jgi:lysine biosynthesis protein LysW